MSLVTIARFSKPEEAHLLRLRLGAGGVEAYVQDENLVQMDWLYSNAIGGVRVQIAEEDEERAEEILREEPGDMLDAERPVCPHCASRHTAPDEMPRRVAFALLWLVSFPFLFAKDRWRCADCGRTWRESRPPGAIVR